MKLLDDLKAVALFLIAAGLFVMSYVVYDVMGKHSRYTPVDLDEDVVVVMDTHTGKVWSISYELPETGSAQTLNSTKGKSQLAANRLTARVVK